MYAVQQHLGVNAGIVKMVCEGLNNYKSRISKTDDCKCKFEYIQKENMRVDYKKSAKNVQKRTVRSI